MTGKSDKWDIRKNKFAVFYYILMIIFTVFMLLILFGIFNTDTVFFGWQA